MKFRIGERVVALKNLCYCITTDGWTGIVSEIQDRKNEITVEGKGSYYSDARSHRYDVCASFFIPFSGNMEVSVFPQFSMFYSEEG